MGLFDIFSQQPAQNAAGAQAAGLTAGYGSLADLFNQGRGALTSNAAAAGGALTSNAGNAADALTKNYSAGVGPWMQNYNTGQSGVQSLGDALGLNGAEGNSRATAAFWNNPAIKSQLDVGSQNVMRNQTATGQLNSGKTNVDLQNYGQQVASQGWQNYVSSLTPYLNFSNQAAGGVGNMYAGLGSGLAGVYGGLGSNLAGVSTGLGTGLAGSFGGQGNASYGANAGVGNANANADLAAYNASGNMWGAGLGIAGLGANALGGGGAQKLGSNLFNTFGSQGGPTGFTGTMSDVRVKEDIKPVGKLFDGLNVYQFRYKGTPRTHIGLMAQEVEERNPDAVREFDGIKMVDYKRAMKPAADYASALMRVAA